MTHTASPGLLLLSVLMAAICTAAGCGTGNVSATVSEAAGDTAAADTAAASEPDDDTAAAKDDGTAAEPVSDGAAAEVEETPEKPVAVANRPQEVIEISFDDLICNIQADIVFREWMLTDRAKELDGSRIRVAGFMMPFTQQEGIAEFVLLRNTECKFGPGGQADHLIRVKLQDGVTTDYRGDRPLDVVGTLKINPYQGVDGNTWCIYDMDGESVKWKRR